MHGQNKFRFKLFRQIDLEFVYFHVFLTESKANISCVLQENSCFLLDYCSCRIKKRIVFKHFHLSSSHFNQSLQS